MEPHRSFKPESLSAKSSSVRHGFPKPHIWEVKWAVAGQRQAKDFINFVPMIPCPWSLFASFNSFGIRSATPGSAMHLLRASGYFEASLPREAINANYRKTCSSENIAALCPVEEELLSKLRKLPAGRASHGSKRNAAARQTRPILASLGHVPECSHVPFRAFLRLHCAE